MILGNPSHPVQVPRGSVKGFPIFGILSVAFPLLGIPLAYLTGMVVSMPTDGSGEPDSIGAFCAFAAILDVVILLSFISAIVALARTERWLILSLMGLILSFAPLVWFSPHDFFITLVFLMFPCALPALGVIVYYQRRKKRHETPVV
jgi:hypothetical protein